VPARIDEIRVDVVGEVGRFLLGRTAGACGPQEFYLHEVPVVQLVVEFVDDGIDTALADPDGHIEVVRGA